MLWNWRIFAGRCCVKLSGINSELTPEHNTVEIATCNCVTACQWFKTHRHHSRQGADTVVPGFILSIRRDSRALYYFLGACICFEQLACYDILLLVIKQTVLGAAQCKSAAETDPMPCFPLPPSLLRACPVVGHVRLSRVRCGPTLRKGPTCCPRSSLSPLFRPVLGCSFLISSPRMPCPPWSHLPKPPGRTAVTPPSPRTPALLFSPPKGALGIRCSF